MQTKNRAFTEKIIKSVVEHYKLRNEADLAARLGVPHSTLSSWKTRGSVNADKLCAIFNDLRRDWLRTGEGPMFREPIQAQANIVAPVAKITAEATNQNFDVAGGMMITKKVLESGTGYANALWHNLKSFDAAVDREEEVGEMKEMMGKIMAGNKLLMEKIANIEKATASPDAQKRDSAANA